MSDNMVTETTPETVDTEPTINHESEPTTTNDAPISTTTSDAQNIFQELMTQMKDQQSQFAALQARFEAEKKARAAVEEKMEVSNKRKRDERARVVDGTLKEYISNMMNKFSNELSPYKDDLAKIISGMKDAEEAEPMIKLLRLPMPS